MSSLRAILHCSSYKERIVSHEALMVVLRRWGLVQR